MIIIWMLSSKVYKVLITKTTIVILLLCTTHYSSPRKIAYINRVNCLSNLLCLEAEQYFETFKHYFAYHEIWKSLAKKIKFPLLLKHYFRGFEFRYKIMLPKV